MKSSSGVPARRPEPRARPEPARAPGRESVWDYPRPPRLEPCARRIRVVHHGEVVAETTRALRMLETSHPPVYYLPAADVRRHLLRPSPHETFCEFKGIARYWHIVVGDRIARDAAWSYPRPAVRYAALTDYVALYPDRVDLCTVDGERVTSQDGDFYGGWITPDVEGPFKGGPGTHGW